MISVFTDTLDEPCRHVFLCFHKPGFLQFLEHSEDNCVEDLEESDLCFVLLLCGCFGSTFSVSLCVLLMTELLRECMI